MAQAAESAGCGGGAGCGAGVRRHDLGTSCAMGRRQRAPTVDGWMECGVWVWSVELEEAGVWERTGCMCCSL
eukprot:60577-Chlamydomonas_euryale.AAC.3